MCGRFYVPQPDDSAEELVRLMRELEQRRRAREPGFSLKRGELRPGDTAAVIAPNRGLERSVFAMRWGFRTEPYERPKTVQLRMELVPEPQETAGRLVFNARSESAARKPLFAESMACRRCIIPAAFYYEWDHRAAVPVKYRFGREDGEPLWLAGIYRVADGKTEFTILTREAAGGVERFHDRMPVIADRSRIADWLDRTAPPGLLLDHPVICLAWEKAE